MKKNGVSICSDYSPEREAERFILGQGIKQGKYLFVVTGAGQGQLAHTLLRLYPGSRVLSVFFDDALFFNAGAPPASWYPGSSSTLTTFLNTEIDDYFLPLLKLILWKPCSRAFPNMHRRALAAIHTFISERNASIATTVTFGRQWIRNTLLNFLHLDHVVTLDSHNLPIVITAAGPSLALSLQTLARHRNSLFLVALPSSLSALHYSGIVPDLIVNTDSGLWNTYHFARYPHHDVPVAMPLTARAARHKTPVLLLNQQTFLESMIIEAMNLQAVKLPENGTVAGTALLLASSISSSPIIFAGLDLAYNDIHEHVSPHAFRSLLEVHQNRFTPLLSLFFKRAYDKITPGIRNNQNRALHTYETWFNRVHPQNDIYRLNPSSISLNTFKNIDNRTFATMVQSYSGGYIPRHRKNFYYDAKNRRRVLRTLLGNSMKQIRSALSAVTDCTSLDTFSTMMLRNPAVYELLELTELQNILKKVNIIAHNDILRKEDIQDIFLQAMKTMGDFHV